MSNKVFLDTNIFVDFLINENKVEEYNKIRGVSDKSIDDLRNTKNTLRTLFVNGASFVLNTSTITNAVYLLSEKQKIQNNLVMNKIIAIESDNDIFSIIEEQKHIREEAQKYCQKNNADYEDVLQYFCAKYADCDLIITNDKKFPKLDIPLKRTDPNIPDYMPTKTEKSISDLKEEFSKIFSNTVDKNKAGTKKDKQ